MLEETREQLDRTPSARAQVFARPGLRWVLDRAEVIGARSLRWGGWAMRAGLEVSRGGAAQRAAVFSLAALFVMALDGCDRIGGRTVMVEFRSAEGLDSGRPVYFAGVKVGETGSPTIVKGQARVPVYLSRRHRDALPSGAVFAVGDDSNNPSKRCLLGYAVSTVPHRAEDDTEVYQGVSSEVELALLIGAEQAREFMEKLKRLYPQ